jgi:hypothetical protein
MSQGLRILVAALAAVLLLPGVRAGEPQPTIQCKICVVRVTDDCYDILRAASVGCPKCCESCPRCPTCSHTPCEQKTANTSSCDQACCKQKCGSEECCDNCRAIPATLSGVLDSCTFRRLMEIAESQPGCDLISAPRVSALPGQTAAVRTNDVQCFVTHFECRNDHGREAFVANNEHFDLGLKLKLRSSLTPDHKTIVLDVDSQMTDLDTPNAPLFPVTTTITPVFEGGAQGQPIPFTQFIQQPSFTTRGMHKIAACPEGKTLVLDCGRRTFTAEVENALPVLSEIPIIGDLFRSKSTETVNDHLLVFVTPTIQIDEAGEESSVETTTETALPLFAVPVMCEEGRVTPVSNVEYLPNAPRPITPPVPCQAFPAQGCPTACPCPGACPCPSTASVTVIGMADCMLPHPTIQAVPCPSACQACPTQCPGACPCPTIAPPAVAAPPLPMPVTGMPGFVFVQPYAVPVSGYVPPCAAPCPTHPTQCAQAACPCPSCPTQCGQGANCPRPTQAPFATPSGQSQVQLDMKLVLVSDEFFDRDGAGVWTRFAPKDERGDSIFVCGDDVCRFIADAQAKGCAKVLSEPRLVTLSERKATFLSGGQAAVRVDGETRIEPFGTQVTFNPVVSADGQFVRIAMELLQSESCEGQCSCPHAAQHAVNSHESNVTFSMPWGRTMVRCENAAGKPGQHLYVLTTPYLIRQIDNEVCVPAPAPTCPPPCVATFTGATPIPAPPCVAVAAVTSATPMPCVQPVAAVAPVPYHCPDLPLVRLMIEYHEASRCGDKARARNLAAQCIAIDPTCFSR